MHKSISLVIPCLNEEVAAANVLDSVGSVRLKLLNEYQFDEVQVIVVDDGSRDRSVAICETFEFVKLVRNPHNLGYGESLKAGFRLAKGEWICFMDMDSSYPVGDIPQMWQSLVKNDADIVIGRRAFQAEGMSVVRGTGNWLFSLLCRVLLGIKERDVCSGFRLFKRERLPEILAISESTLGFSLQMSIQLSQLDVKVHEIEIDYHPREGDSKLSVWRDGLGFFVLIVSAAAKLRLRSNFRRAS